MPKFAILHVVKHIEKDRRMRTTNWCSLTAQSKDANLIQHCVLYIMRRLESTLRNWPFLFGNRTYQWQPLDWTRQLETRNCTVRTLQMIQKCGQITSYIKNKISPLREPIRLASLLWAVRLHQFVVLIRPVYPIGKF
jgi:hypothetical protein